jgi:hypothetical protein
MPVRNGKFVPIHWFHPVNVDKGDRSRALEGFGMIHQDPALANSPLPTVVIFEYHAQAVVVVLVVEDFGLG